MVVEGSRQSSVLPLSEDMCWSSLVEACVQNIPEPRVAEKLFIDWFKAVPSGIDSITMQSFLRQAPESLL